MKKILNFLNSLKAVCGALILIVLLVLIYHINYTKNINVYSFGGYNDEFTVLDGTIYIGNDINRFSSPNIIYSGSKIVLSEYTIGYYIGDNALVVVSNKNIDELNGVNMKDIIENTEFSFTETHKNADKFSKSKVKEINNLYFRVEGKTSDGGEISLKVPLEVTKISK